MPARRRNGWGADTLITIGIALATFFGGMLVNAWTVASNLATKPYVDEGLQNQKRYTDEKTASALEKAIDHSDSNRQAMMIEMKGYGADLRAVSVKTDLVLDSVRQMQLEKNKRN